MTFHQREKRHMGAWLLYAASVIGIINLFGFSSFTHEYTNLIWLDIVVYVVLFVLAYFIHRGFTPARIIYGILAVIWYIALFAVLPQEYGHSIDLFATLIQIILTILGFWILYFG